MPPSTRSGHFQLFDTSCFRFGLGGRRPLEAHLSTNLDKGKPVARPGRKAKGHVAMCHVVAGCRMVVWLTLVLAERVRAPIA